MKVKLELNFNLASLKLQRFVKACRSQLGWFLLTPVAALFLDYSKMITEFPGIGLNVACSLGLAMS